MEAWRRRRRWIEFERGVVVVKRRVREGEDDDDNVVLVG